MKTRSLLATGFPWLSSKLSLLLAFPFLLGTASVLTLSPVDSQFTYTGSLNVARAGHTATLLPSGKVLVAGGYNFNFGFQTILASAELYDPSTESWSATDGLSTARYEHTATLLANGRVLVVGGSSGGVFFSSAELYDPSTGSWSATGSLGTASSEHTATLLPSGKVLVAGGYNNGVFLASAELYDPASGIWTATGDLNTARANLFRATLLPNGMVLVTGGNNSDVLTSAELYNSASGTWNTTGSLNVARYFHTATLLANGKVLVAGGNNSDVLTSAELYDSASGTWNTTGSLNVARYFHTATLLANGKVLASGGRNNSSFLSSSELYDSTSGTWGATGSLNIPRYLHSATLLSNGNVLVSGGESISGPSATAELYNAGNSPAITLSIHAIPSTASPTRITNLNDDVDAPLRLVPNETLLRNQPTIPSPNGGLVADGVTPLLIQLDSSPTPTQPTTFTFATSVTDGTVNGLHDVNNHLQVLQTSGNPQFVTGNSVVLSSAHPNGFAYISGIKSEEVQLDSCCQELSVTLTATQQGQSTSATVQFKIRKPPVVLVHGYSSDAQTWSGGGGDFLGTLQNAFPQDFIVPVDYGVDYSAADPDFDNRTKSFVYLAQKLNNALPPVGASGPFHDWALTRYDLVCHSQGGILARMLCAAQPGRFGVATRFKSLSNAYRGRFRRIVTVGAPQNGTTIEYYAKRVLERFYFFGAGDRRLFVSLYGDRLQDKFDPFGDQIRDLNDPNDLGKRIDPEAKFHVIRGAIQGIPRIFRSFFLHRPSISSVVVPNGSDGIADFESQTAQQSGQAVNTVSESVSHCGPEFFFSVSPGSTETTSAAVATEAISYLNGPATDFFAPFELPILLDQSRKDAIDAVVPQSVFANILGHSIRFSPRAKGRSGSSGTVLNLTLTPDPKEPLDGDATWMAEAFGPNGVSTDGLMLVVNPEDSTAATLTVENNVEGDIVVYASYPSSTGKLVVGVPIVPLSTPIGAKLIGISLEPVKVNASIGDNFTFQVWGSYDNGASARLFELGDQSPQYKTSDSSVASIVNESEFIAAGVGEAMVTSNFRGFSAEAAVQVSPLPTPVPSPMPTGAISRKIHGGAGNFDINLPLTGTPGIECRTGGATNDYEIVVNFPEPVTLNGGVQAQVTLGVGNIGTGGNDNGGMVIVNGNTVTIPLTNVANARIINVTLFDVNGVSDVIIPMSMLIGDVNANGAVNASDVALSKSRIGQTVDQTNFRSDVNANGTINASDVSLIKSRIGTALP